MAIRQVDRLVNLEKASTAPEKVSDRSIALKVDSNRENTIETCQNCKNKGIKKEMVREKINEERKKSRKDM